MRQKHYHILNFFRNNIQGNQMTIDIKNQLFINKLVQKVIPMEEGGKWFASFDLEKKSDILKFITFCILQAGGIAQYAEEAIEESKLKKTFTPCCLLIRAKEIDPLSSNNLKNSLLKICSLPDSESNKSFILLISLLFISISKKEYSADEMRKKWWLNDLSDSIIVQSIIDKYK